MLLLKLTSLLVYTIIYIYFVFNMYYEKRDSNIFLFYMISCFIFYFIIANVIMLLFFYQDIINKTGQQGEKGYSGEIGLMGQKGICNISCFDKKCKYDFMDAIEYKLNELLSNDFKKNANIIKMISNGVLNMEKKKYNENKKEYLAVKIVEDITNKKYNDIVKEIQKRIDNLKKLKENQNKNVMKNIELDIEKLEFQKEMNINLSITDKKLINNVLNEIVFALCSSKQYQQAINENLGDKTKEDVNNYVITVLQKIVEQIYNSSGNTFETKINFFTSADERFTDAILYTLMKYDVYMWGLQRIFRPLHIKMDDSIKYYNYLPEDNKPPLKIVETNDYISIIDTQHYGGKKETKELLTFYETRNKFKYREEIYNPIGAIFEDQNLSNLTTDVRWKDSMNIMQLKKDLENFKTKLIQEKMKPNPKIKAINEEIEKLEKKKNIMKPTLDKIIRENIHKKSNKIYVPRKSTIVVTGDTDVLKGFKILADNKKNLKERETITIVRPECNEGYSSLGDYAIKGSDFDFKGKDKNLLINTVKCLPSKCLEPVKKEDLKNQPTDSMGILYHLKDDKNNGNKENAYNLFRHEKDYDKNPLKTIKTSCLINTEPQMIQDTASNVGIGWHGRPLRQPKYSIFSYLINMPQAIISAKNTNYKYYLIHTELYNARDRDDPKDKQFLTSSRNLYYVLALNNLNNKYDKCLAVNKDGTSIIREKIKNQEECYWQIMPLKDNDMDEIRLKSFKFESKYLIHDRNQKNFRREVVKSPVYERLNVLDKKNNNQIFINVKSKYGTHIETTPDHQSHKDTHKKDETEGIQYYESDNDIAKNKISKKIYSDYKDRKIKLKN